MKNALITALVVSALVACSSDTPTELMVKAKTAIENNEQSTAEIHLKNLLQQTPENGEARLLLAEVYQSRGAWPSALKEFRKAQEYKIDSDRLAPGLLEAMANVEPPQESLRVAIALTSQNPAVQAQILFHSGIALERIGNRSEAVTAYSDAIQLDDNLIKARVALHKINAQKGTAERQASISSLQSLKSQYPNDSLVLVALGDLLVADGRSTEAMEAFKATLKLDGKSVLAMMRLANIHITAREFEIASPLIEDALKLAPGSPILLTQKAQIDHAAGQHSAALMAAQGALNAAPDFMPALAIAAAASLSNGSLEQAETHANRLRSLAPQSLEGYRLLAATYLRKGDAQQALDLLNPIVGRGVEDPGVLALAGEAAMKANDPVQAQQHFERAVAFDAADPNKRLYLAMAKLSTGDDLGGIGDLQAAAELSPDSPVANYALVSQLIRAKRFSDAEKAIAELDRKQPGDAANYYLRGILMLAQQDLPAARSELDKAVAAKPNFVEAIVRLAAIDLKEGHRDAAKKRFFDLVEAEPENEAGLLALAQITLTEADGSTAAIELIERALKANPGGVRAPLMLASIRVQQGAPGKAIETLRSALASQPENPSLLEALANSQRMAGSKEQALSTISELENLRGEDAGVLFRMAVLRSHLGDLNGALRGHQAALKLRPEAIEPRVAGAIVQARLGQTEQALAVARKLQRERAELDAGWLLEGDLQHAAKNWLASATAYQRGLKIDPGNMPAFFKYDSMLRRAKKIEQADVALQEQLQAYPDDASLLRFAGDRASVAEDYAKASKLYERTVEIAPTDAIAWNNLAWVQHRQGNDRAIDSANRALDLNPNSAATLDTVAGILADSDQLDRAIDLQRRAVSIEPAKASFRFRLALALKKAGKIDEAKAVLNEFMKLSPTPSETALASARKMLAEL